MVGSGPGDGGSSDSADKKMVGNFEVLEEIGRGAMGAVFKARQVSVDRIVALKVLPPRLAKDEKFIGRFLREARAAAHLNHPNIVQAIDAGHAKPYYYFAMEFVDGPSADALLQSEGPLRERRALEIARDVARALDHAHQADIVHRDVKPDNILIAADGTAKLADLGLARETVDLDSRLTQAGTAVGTPDYISPEQARGEDELDGRTDVYSLGATLYHLVTGSPPYTGKSAVDIMYKHLHDPPPDPRAVNPQVSAGMAAIVSKAMAKRRQQRYANAEALLNDLERLLAMKRTTVASVGPRITGRIVSQRTVDTPIPRHRRRKSRTGLYVGIAAAVVALVVLGILLVPKGEKEPEAKGPGPVVQTPTTEPAVATLSDQKRTLARVRGWVKAHPGEYREGIQKYEWLIPKLTDLEVKMDAEEALAALNEARASAANAAGVRRGGPAPPQAAARAHPRAGGRHVQRPPPRDVRRPVIRTCEGRRRSTED